MVALTMRISKAVVLAWVAFSSSAFAQARAQVDARLLSSNPDTPASSLLWRSASHGIIGVQVPVIGAPGDLGPFVQVPALIELHNSDHAFVPADFWRGRISAEGFYRLALSVAGTPAVLSLGGAAEHESDHATSPSLLGYLDINSLSARGDLTLERSTRALTVSALGRFHFLTCTVSPGLCWSGIAGAGSQAFEGAFEAVFDQSLGERRDGAWRLFASVYGSWLFPHDLVVRERRLVFDAGIGIRRARYGLFQLYGTAFVGNDVGIFRASTAKVFGVGLRWAP